MSQSARRAPLDYPAAASYLGISTRQLRRAVAERRVETIKLTGRTGKTLFDPDVLDQWIDASRVPAKR